MAEAFDQRVTNERYLSEIVEPTVDDFRSKPSNVRIAFLTCVAIDHSVDYLAFPGDRSRCDRKEHRDKHAGLRKQFREENAQFGLASEVANAFKHVKATSKTGSKQSKSMSDRPQWQGG